MWMKLVTKGEGPAPVRLVRRIAVNVTEFAMYRLVRTGRFPETALIRD